MHYIYHGTRKAAIFLFFLGITAILMYPGSTVASDQNIIEGAKKEGKLSLYTSMNITDAHTMIQHFKKKYPFIEVAFIRSSSEPLLNRLEQETAVKRYNADAITATFGIWNTMVNKGMLMKYKSPESAVYPSRMTHPEGFWTVMYLQVYSIAYNTALVAKDLAPRRYADLLNPRWRGKIGLDYNDQTWSGIIVEIMGEQKGVEFLRNLAAQNLYLRVGKTLLVQLLSANEFPILANVHIDTALDMKKRGANVEWVPGLNPIPASTHLAGIYAQAPHPNAAKLYVDFVLSVEGQKVLSGEPIVKFAARPGLESDWNKIVKGYDLYPVDPAMMSDYDKINKRWNEIFRRR